MSFEQKIADLVRKGVHDDVVRANLLTGGEVFLVLEDSDTDFNLIQQRCGDKNVYTTLNDAEDASQEVFLRAYKAIHRYDPSKKFSTWLMSIASNYCIFSKRYLVVLLLLYNALQ